MYYFLFSFIGTFLAVLLINYFSEERVDIHICAGAAIILTIIYSIIG